MSQPAPGSSPGDDSPAPNPSERKPPRFYDAGPWVVQQFNSKEVQDIISNVNRKKRYLVAAELVEPRFREQFPHPFRGETDDEFQRRRMSNNSARRDKMVRWQAETEMQHKKRMALLRKVRRLGPAEQIHRSRCLAEPGG